MKIAMLWKIIDDNGEEVNVNDIVTMRANVARKLKMEEPGNAIIKEIQATFITVLFEDPLYGHTPIKLRTNEVNEIVLYRKHS